MPIFEKMIKIRHRKDNQMKNHDGTPKL